MNWRPGVLAFAAAAAVALASVACNHRDSTSTGDIAIGKSTGHLGELDRIWSMVELPDGRVVFPQRSAVVRADLSAGATDTIGRAGAGPGEYKQPYRVSLLHGGLALLDGQLSRLTIWNADASVRSTENVSRYATFGGMLDSLGHAYFQQLPANVTIGDINEANRAKDSTQLYRMTLPGPLYDTIGRIFEIGTVTVRFGGGATFRPRLYQTPDVWGAMPDGRVWIARGRENRIDWMSPDGRWTPGTPRPFTPIPTTDADRRKMRGFPGLPGAAALDTMYEPMAPEKGPFSEAVAAIDGEVWTRMQLPRGNTTERYAVFPVNGPSTRTVSLPLGCIVVAITAANVYAIHDDEDGFFELERFARPVVQAAQAR